MPTACRVAHHAEACTFIAVTGRPSPAMQDFPHATVASVDGVIKRTIPLEDARIDPPGKEVFSLLKVLSPLGYSMAAESPSEEQEHSA